MQKMLTKKQKKIYDFVANFIEKNDYSPSLEEIGGHFKLAVSTVHEHIEGIKNKGYLRKRKKHARSLNPVNLIKDESISIPILGTIAAGQPIEAIGEYNKKIEIPRKLISNPNEHYALQVQGRSMIQEGIFDGDYVILKKQNFAQNGETVVALINNNEVTLKKIFKTRNGFILQPANPTLKPQKVKHLIVQGKVISVIRNFDSKKYINQKENLNLFIYELRELILQFHSEIINSFKKNKEYQIWLKTEEKSDRNKFCLETVYTLFNEIILLWVCKDKELIDFEIINNYSDYEFLKKQARKIYNHIFENNIFDWYQPDEYFFQRINNLFNKFNFSTIDRDILGKLYEKFISIEERKKLGQFYTPEVIIDYILDSNGYKTRNKIIGKKLIDISCGSGGFLVRATNRLIKNLKNKNYPPTRIIKEIINSVYGFDINPFACYLAETNILLQILDLTVEAKKRNNHFIIPKINIFQTNTIETPSLFSKDQQIIIDIKNKTNKFSDGFDFVVGNPPYLEAKKMDKKTKLLCKEKCSGVAIGAFDLYICFIDIGLKLLKQKGGFGYIIPNKFLIAKYAQKIREKILNDYSLKEIIDVSECEVFEKISVYPVITIIKNEKPKNNNILYAAEHIESTKQIKNRDFIKIKLKQEIYRRDDYIFFILPSQAKKSNLLLKLLGSHYKLLENYLNIRWTISFHSLGLRDKFIFQKKPKSSYNTNNTKKLIGGKSFAGNKDIQRYRLNWGGFWIIYNEELAKKFNNPLPPKNIFEQEKIIICQNAKRLRATYDNQGFFCKDTFFIANLKKDQTDLDLKFFLALLNSKLMHFFYANIYKGTHVAGGYLHYLVGYLNSLPIAAPTKKQHKDIVILVDKILKVKNDNEFNVLDKKIDDKIYQLYKLNNYEIQIIESFI